MPTQTPLLDDDTLQELLGTRLTADRFAAVIAAYADVLVEIGRLRELDLTAVHPAIIFEPSAPYRLTRRERDRLPVRAPSRK
jgi:hypothetical protein